MATIKSLSIAARAVLDLHALNNEGNESNRLMTRQVGIVTPTYDENRLMDGFSRATVNAISGDMNKHIFADYFRHVALERDLPLCEACKALDPGRMMANPDFQAYIETKPPAADIVNRLISCALDDVGGILITGSGQSIKRKSAVEFGWTVALPGASEVQEYIHARHAVTRVTRTKADKESSKEVRDQAASEKEMNIGQMVFNRPASSGVYAFVAHLDACAIGFNDITQEYPISAAERAERLRATLLALAQTLLHPKGALTSTQLPHVVDIEGFVSVSQTAASAPLISPLTDGYIQRGMDIAQGINRLHGANAVDVLPFAGGEGLLNQLASLVEDGAPGVYRG
ncbi:MAG: DevR family CRISPR-associated autoregulator [Anaerolineae bacterium]|nr:DevR family CRISPR-associated autoregulator [Anaerolineae bacterium]